MSALTESVRLSALATARPLVMGRITRVLGLQVQVSGLSAAIGDVVSIGERNSVLAEVVASSPAGLTCLPLGSTTGLTAGTTVLHTGGPLSIHVGPELLGRVVDGIGRPVDGGPSLAHLEQVGVDLTPPQALTRPRIDTQIGTGVRAVDALTPLGRGQRVGIMAGSGVGKSSLLSMVARGTDADISVIALVGERGREVREFIENDLGPEGLARSVVVVATSDAPPVERLRAAFVATRIAEWFRDSGRHVMLMMDSLTRIAMAQREIGLSAGEPPATRGYPPSVFALMPQLLERAGTSPAGSITGLYTVLIEGDDLQDPIGDTARSILDGHIVLSRRLATAGHFPAIDVLESISRVTSAVTDRDQQADATRMRRLMAAHREARDLIGIGAYVAGTNLLVDRAIALREVTDLFLRQDMEDVTPAEQSWSVLSQMVAAA